MKCIVCGSKDVSGSLDCTLTTVVPDQGQHRKEEPQRYLRVSLARYRCSNGHLFTNGDHDETICCCAGCRSWNKVLNRQFRWMSQGTSWELDLVEVQDLPGDSDANRSTK